MIKKDDILLVIEDDLAYDIADSYENTIFSINLWFGYIRQIQLGYESHHIGEIDDGFLVAQKLIADIQYLSSNA